MHTTPQIITSAMQSCFSGESFRNIKNFFRVQSVNISHVTVYKWVNKYTRLMETYLEKLKPKVGNAWRTDDLYVKIRGNTKYLYALMDDETRFWIAQQVSANKYTAAVRPLFKKAKEVAGKRPNVLISDGAHNFNQAFKDEFFTRLKPRSRHVRHIRLQGEHNNNKMERLNEVRDREKVMRGLKTMNKSVLPGYQMYHNYFRPHEGIGNVRTALRFVSDDNTANDHISCEKLDTFVALVNTFENRGLLTVAQADDLLQQAQVIQDAIGCGGSSSTLSPQDAEEAAAKDMTSTSLPPSADNTPINHIHSSLTGPPCLPQPRYHSSLAIEVLRINLKSA